MTDPVDVMARTIWGEARGEPEAGKVAVGWVIKNRAKKGGWWGKTITEVCLKPHQFSCWNHSDPNADKIAKLDDSVPSFAECIDVAHDVIFNRVPDPTEGATSYHTTNIHPMWADKMTKTVTIGHHVFYREGTDV